MSERSPTGSRRRLALGSVVPISRILVTGMSGTGKSSALAELGRRGYRVVDTDDPGWREYQEDVQSADEVRRGEWLWVEERMTKLLDSDVGRSLFVQGCVRTKTGAWYGGSSPHQPRQSPCHGPRIGPNMLRPIT